MDDANESNKVYGQALSSLEFTYGIPSFDDIPDPRCNTVSFVKRDGLLDDCRNVVAISAKYICYAVRGTLMRVIHTLSGDKILLRGHESHILDLKFSPVDRSLLCSVDGGARLGSHVFVWQMLDGKELNHLLVCQFSFQASFVQPHPRLAHVWGLSFQKSIAIFSTVMASLSLHTYEDLPLNAKTEGDVLDLSFSDDGLLFAAAVSPYAGFPQYSVVLFQLPIAAHDATLIGSLLKLRVLYFDNLSSAQFVNPFGSSALMTAAQLEPYDMTSRSVGVSLTLWRWKTDEESEAEVWQRINVLLPVHDSSGQGQGQGQGGTRDSSSLTSLIVCSPRGKYVVVSDRRSHVICCLAVSPVDPPRPGLAPIYHTTYLNLKWPVWSAVATCISGRDHHSDEEMEHLEVNCLQEQESDQAAVQQYHVPWRLVFGAMEDAVECATTADVRPVPPPDDMPSGEGATCSDLSDSAEKMSLTPAAAAAASAPETRVSHLLGINGSAHGSEALSRLLGAMDTESETVTMSAVVDEDYGVEEEGEGEGGMAEEVLLDIHPVSEPTLPAPVAAAAAVDRRALALISLLKSGPAAAASAPASAPVDLTHSASTTVGSARSEPPSQTVIVAADDGWDDAVMLSRDMDMDMGMGAMNKEKEEEDVGLNLVLSQLTTALHSLETRAVTSKQLGAVKTEVLAAVQAAERRQVGQQREGWDRLLQAADKERAALQTTVQQAMNAQWRAELEASLSRSLSASLSQSLSDVVKSEVQVAVGNALKQSLAKSFRKSFESSLLPAFQAGTDRMFAQIGTSFEEGMGRLMEQGEAVRKDLVPPLQELQRLREEVTSLRSELNQMAADHRRERSLAAAAVTLDFTASTTTTPMATPEQLLDSGRVGDAVRSAVELKEADALLQLLVRLSPAEVVEHCDTLCVLCVAQQLAADFAQTAAGQEPFEGVTKRLEWLKELLMACDADDCDADLGRARVLVIGSVIESLRSIEVWLTREQKLQGTVKTDIKMLKAYISNFV